MMRLLTSSSSTTSDQAIDTPPLGVTALPQFFGALTALGAATIAIYQVIAGVDTTDPLKIALIGLVGVGILAWAIAAAGDSLARAYAAAHVTRTEPDKVNQPAIQSAAVRLADAYAAAHGMKLSTQASTADGGTSATTASVYSPVSSATPKETHFPISPPLIVKVRGKDALAVAVMVSGESGKETQRYLVGLPDSQLTWVSNDAISLPAAITTPNAISAPTATIAGPITKPPPLSTPTPEAAPTEPGGGTPQPGTGSTSS